MKFSMHFFFFVIFSSFAFLKGEITSFLPAQEARILFLVQQGQHQQALALYQEQVENTQKHHYELLHQMSLALLNYGSLQSDPETQLLSLFGAHISANIEAYPILEQSLKSKYPQIQVLAISCLAQFHQDQAYQSVLKMLGSPYALVRFQAIAYLCKSKHPMALEQTESLMFKTPAEILALYPPLLAELGTVKAIQLLRRLLNYPSNEVRQSVILNVALHKRDDFLPQIRQQALHSQFAQQEACAYALGLFKDEMSLDQLNKLSNAQYPSVVLAANWALYQLGKTTRIHQIEELALKENLFAISALGTLNEKSIVLLQLLQHQNRQVKINAQLALLNQHHEAALKDIEKLLIKDQLDLGFTLIHSPGTCFKAWKITTGASEILAENAEAYKSHLEFKEEILLKIRDISEKEFLKIAHLIFAAEQNDLIPMTTQLLGEMETAEAMNCLKYYQQKFGAPLIRHYCNLVLYRLGENEFFSAQLREWIKKQNQTDLIQLQPYDPWKSSQNTYELKPAETSRLMVDAFQEFAQQQDRNGIELLIETIATGNEKNKYALAGLLLRATQ